jgi:hypothetical protein
MDLIMIELHIFTNCTKSAPSTDIILKTYQSFCDTFFKIEPTIWCDINPERKKITEYTTNLLKIFRQDRINLTMSLSDGYIKAIENSKAEYLFMLEHDWIFNKKNIKHDLFEIIDNMRHENIYHLRFNKRKNEKKLWDRWLEQFNRKNFFYCVTPAVSNNPHIINRKKYLQFVREGAILKMPGSKGIEDQITKKTNMLGCIYGGKRHPACVTHLDGRK